MSSAASGVLPPPLAPLPGAALAVDLMLLCWLAAVVIAVWGALREARAAEQRRHQVLESDPAPGPVPGFDRLFERWALWALVLAGIGLICLGYASGIVRH